MKGARHSIVVCVSNSDTTANTPAQHENDIGYTFDP